MDIDHDLGKIYNNITDIDPGNNPLTISGSAGIIIPSGTTLERPTPTEGIIRKNSDTGFMEIYADGSWVNIKEYSLSTLPDVTLTSPSNGNLLSYNGTSWVNQTTIPGAYTTVISSWTLLSGNRYYADVTHNLGTSNIVINTYNNSTNALIQVDNIVIQDINTIRVTVVGNSVSVRITAIANGLTVGSVLTNVANSLQVINAGGTVSIQEDLLANRPLPGVSGRIFLTTDTKTLYRDNGVSWDVISAGTAGTLISTTYYANSVDSPITSDFAVNGVAPAISDPLNTALDVRSFSNTTEQGIAFLITPPVGAINITITTIGRAATTPGGTRVVQPRLYFRAIPNGTAMGAWSTAYNMGVISIPNNIYYKTDIQTFSISTFGLSTGITYLVEFTRNIAPTSGTNLGSEWYMPSLTVAFS